MACINCGCKDCGCKDGDRGLRGPAGEKGDTGIAGAIGLTGPIGWQGLTGAQGTQGPQGVQGLPGVNGGDVAGPPGPTGIQGVQGIQGMQGNNGADGVNGVDGANGQGRLTYVINTNNTTSVYNVLSNQGVIMKNTGFVDIQLPATPVISDKIRVVGTSIGTGGWKITAGVSDRIELGTTGASLITGLGGEVIIDSTNYRDVITIMYDGVDTWLVISKIFANNNYPFFTT